MIHHLRAGGKNRKGSKGWKQLLCTEIPTKSYNILTVTRCFIFIKKMYSSLFFYKNCAVNVLDQYDVPKN